MNKKLFYGAFAFAALGLASCSSEEPVNNGGNNVTDADSYMYVRLTSVGNSGTRAENTNLDDENDFEGGIGKENDLEATDVRFYFFDKDGNPFTLAAANVDGTVSNTNMVTPLKLSASTTNGNTTGVANGILVLGKATGPYVGTTPAQVVCVANLSAEKMAELANKTLNDMAQVIQMVDDAEFPNKFGMSSTTYASGHKEVFAADVTGCIKTTASEAQQNPVDIYIERLAVKLRVEGLADYTSQMLKDGAYVDATYDFVEPDGTVTPKKLKVNLTGWQVRNSYAQCKVIKDLGDVTELDDKFPGFLWNAEAYHRSFWAVTPASTAMLRNTNFNIYDNAQFTLGNYDATAETVNIKYVYPNTAFYEVASTNDVAGNWGKPLSNRMTKCTGIAIRGVVHLEGETDGLDMVNWAGQYHTMADFKEIVANTYNGEAGVTTKVTADAIGLVQITGKNLYTATVNGNSYDRITNIEWWKDGVTSFYINIQHDKYLKDGVETPLFGVVRNHIYNTEVSNVIGLGVPGNEIENPDKDKESYLAARINVLNWKLVSNSVVLE